MRNHLDLAIPLLADLHDVTQVPHAVVDFDLVVEEFLKSGDVENFVGDGLGGVDDVLENGVSCVSDLSQERELVREI